MEEAQVRPVFAQEPNGGQRSWSQRDLGCSHGLKEAVRQKMRRSQGAVYQYR